MNFMRSQIKIEWKLKINLGNKYNTKNNFPGW